MTFNSYTFLIFFGCVVGLYRLPLSWGMRKGILLVSSYLFYSAWNPPFVLLLLLSTVVDWFAAHTIARRTGAVRTGALLLSLGTNLGLLAYFKYADFFLQNCTQLLHYAGIYYEPAALSIILPMGISFYTFQTLSYTIDVYRGDLKPGSSFLDYALYVTFFPQLVAGPIVRATDFLPQCRSEKRVSGERFGWGVVLILVGLFQKSVLADGLFGPVVNAVYSDLDHITIATAWTATVSFSGQLFCDFSGYSACGIGAALCLGFALPDNFRYPFAAVGFSDFWRRWHISLSSWLRDYLYIPLGGNRHGTRRRYQNLWITMLIGGLWHGAAWTYVLWGALHGAYLVIERLLVRLLGGLEIWTRKPVQVVLALLTFFACALAFSIFRAESIADVAVLLKALAGSAPWLPARFPKGGELALVAMVGLLIFHWRMRDRSLEEVANGLSDRTILLIITALLITLLMTHEETRGFIYFQF